MLVSGIPVFTNVDLIGIEEEAHSSCWVLCLECILLGEQIRVCRRLPFYQSVLQPWPNAE